MTHDVIPVAKHASSLPDIASRMFYVGKSSGSMHISIQTSYSRGGYKVKIN